jgi:hypothetical protein
VLFPWNTLIMSVVILFLVVTVTVWEIELYIADTISGLAGKVLGVHPDLRIVCRGDESDHTLRRNSVATELDGIAIIRRDFPAGAFSESVYIRVLSRA